MKEGDILREIAIKRKKMNDLKNVSKFYCSRYTPKL